MNSLSSSTRVVHAGALDDDDPVGRVIVQPCSLRPRTVADAWWPLVHNVAGERPGSRGALRLRLCVEWASDRTLLTQPAALLKKSLFSADEEVGCHWIGCQRGCTLHDTCALIPTSHPSALLGSPMPQDDFVLCLASRRAYSATMYAYHGNRPEQRSQALAAIELTMRHCFAPWSTLPGLPL